MPTRDQPRIKPKLRSLHKEYVGVDHPAHKFFYDEDGLFRWYKFEVQPDWRIQASFLVTVYVAEP